MRYLLFLLLFINVLIGEKIEDTNHPPFSLDSKIILGVVVGNKFNYTIKGMDPDKGDSYYVILDNRTELSDKGINCTIFHSNLLSCEIDDNIVIPNNSKCELKDGYILNKCINTTILYHLEDEKGARSKQYVIDLYVTSKDANNTIQNNPRGFFYNFVDSSSAANTYNEAMYKDAPLNMFKNSKAFKEINVYVKNAVENKKDLSNENVLNDSAATAIMKDSIKGTDKSLFETVSQNTVKALATKVNSNPICTIEREGIKTQTYYICSIDPMISINPVLATHYWANNGYEKKALSTCQSACIQKSQCNSVVTENYTTFVNNKNYLDEASMIEAQNNIEGKTFDKVTIIERNSDGSLIKQFTIDFTSTVNSDVVKWNNDIIPSSVTISPNFSLNTRFANTYKTFIVGNTFVIQPDIAYYATANGEDLLLSYDGDILYSLIFSGFKNVYTCPIPGLQDQVFDSFSSCNDYCQIQRECVKFENSIMDEANLNRINNYCRDVTVSIGGNLMSLESAVNNGYCKLKDEYVLDENNKIGHYFVRDGVVIDPFGPDLGFNEDSATFLKHETAAEIAYSFLDMLKIGKGEGRFDNTDTLDVFYDFNFTKSNDKVSVLPVIDRNGLYPIYKILVKLNPNFFNAVDYDKVDITDLSSSTDINIYKTYINVLQREPDKEGFESWRQWVKQNDISNLSDAIQKAAFNNGEGAGVIVGLYNVQVPDSFDENTTVHTEFKILDNNGLFRTVLLTSPTVDVNWSDPDEVYVFNVYFYLLGREPDILGYSNWVKYLKNNGKDTFLETFINNVKQAAKDVYAIDNPVMDINTSTITSEPSFINANDYSAINLLQNLVLSKSGQFDPNSGMFIEAASAVKNSLKSLIVNKEIFDSDLVHFTRIKTMYKGGGSYILFPIDISQDALSPYVSSVDKYRYTYSYLFVYVDSLNNIKNKKVRDIIEEMYEDLKNGDKKLFAWDLKDMTKAIYKINDETFTGMNSNSLTKYMKRFGRGGFDYLNNIHYCQAQSRNTPICEVKMHHLTT